MATTPKQTKVRGKQNSSVQLTDSRIEYEMSWLYVCDRDTWQKIANEMGNTPEELSKARANFSEDEHRAIDMRFYEERIKKEEEDTVYTNKKTGKPYKRKDLELPPLNPEAQQIMAKQGIPFPGMRRLMRLPLYATSIITDIKEKSPPTEERHRLASAFTVECQEAMHAVTKFVDRCQNNDSQSRNNLIGKYRIWEDKLLQAFEQQRLQLAGKPARLSTQSLAELSREQAQLLFRQVGQMAKIEAEHNSSGEFVSLLISVKTDLAKTPAGTGQMDGKKPNDFLLETAKQVSIWIIDELKIKRFREQDKAFYDDYQEWDRKNDQYLKEIELRHNETKEAHVKRISKIPPPRPCPLDLLAIVDHHTDPHILHLVESTFPERRHEQRFSSEEILKADYVLLTVLHDNALKDTRHFNPINTDIWPQDEVWADNLWQLMTEERSGWKPEFLSIELNDALEKVKADLDKEPAETGQKDKLVKASAKKESMGEIPPESRTSPLSLTRMAQYWGGDMTAKKIRALIRSGRLKAIELNRQSFVFDTEYLPKKVIEKVSK